MSKKNKIILGIDPGFALSGWGVIQSGSGLEVIDYGCIKTSKGCEFSDRLVCVSRELDQIIKKYKPDLAAVEQLFFYKNVKTGIQVGEARGVTVLTMAQNGLPIMEFTPLQIKQAITGYGNATKQQIQRMVKSLLNLAEIPRPDDVADALAVAICAAATKKF